MTDRITEAAHWLATTPEEARPHPLMPYLTKTFGLSYGEAVAAIREANLIRARAH